MPARLANDAIRRVAERFPFPNYVHADGAYRAIPDVAQKYLPPGARILDFGCGPMDKTAVLAELGYQCHGYDDLGEWWHDEAGNRDKILTFAREVGIDFRQAVNGESLPFEKETFDMVMSHDVLEHLHDSPRDIFVNLVELLRPGGLLFCTVPSAVNIRKRLAVLFGRTNYTRFDYFYWWPGPWRGHIREYTKDDCEKLIQYLGLERVEVRAVDHMLRVLPRFVRPFYRLATDLVPGWKDSWLLIGRKPHGWTPQRQLPPDEMAALMRRFTCYH